MRTLAEMMSLDGRRALITGGAGAIGQKIAETIAELGGDLVLVDKPSTSCEQLLHSLQDRWHTRVEYIECDLEKESDRKKLVKQVSRDNGQLDILINNAAFVGANNLDGWVAEFQQQSLDTWRRALEVNLTAVFELSQGLAPELKKKGKGSIINIASIYGVVAPDYELYRGTSMGNPAAYAASKGGLLQLTRWLATTLAPSVRVNAISPGGVERKQPSQFIDRYVKRTPLRRMAMEDDFKGVIALLASDSGSYITGQNLVVDGGWSIW